MRRTALVVLAVLLGGCAMPAHHGDGGLPTQSRTATPTPAGKGGPGDPPQRAPDAPAPGPVL
ncbi:MAG: hypothetical protein ACRYG5_12940 [Janthinobacterium lividum]